MTGNESVTVADNVHFHVLILKPGHSHKWTTENSKLRICSVASGKARVKLGDKAIVLGPNGMFKVKPGAEAAVENRLYMDLALHITTIDSA